MKVHYRYYDIPEPLLEELIRFVNLINAIDCDVFGIKFECRLGCSFTVFWLQLVYKIDHEYFKGRKWMLSPHMLDDEIVKTVWLAFEVAVKHELLEGFRFIGERVFNPHTPFTKFIEASRTEVFRPEPEGS